LVEDWEKIIGLAAAIFPNCTFRISDPAPPREPIAFSAGYSFLHESARWASPDLVPATLILIFQYA
jgi:hypothetical protein